MVLYVKLKVLKHFVFHYFQWQLLTRKLLITLVIQLGASFNILGYIVRMDPSFFQMDRINHNFATFLVKINLT